MTAATSLQESNLAGYPPEARKLATSSLGMLRPLPLVFVATLLRQLSRYDWLFPPERKEMLDQLELLKEQGSGTLQQVAARFDQIPLTADLERMEWATQPDRFSEALTAYLWSSHQMESFRRVAAEYSAKLDALRQKPPIQSPPNQSPRLCIVLLGQGAQAEGIPLFAKLRPKGTLFENVSTSDAVQTASEVLQSRARKSPDPYRHWWIDGGKMAEDSSYVTISYDALSPVRRRILAIMENARTSGSDGPEGLRSLLHQVERQQPGKPEGDPVLDRFTLDLFADGSGTQIYSTTFVQWAAREVLRRAQPSTIVLRYAPRQSERSMNELISDSSQSITLDPQGSLIDADMGSYYTWLSLMRLPSAERDTLIACHEGGRQAIAVSSSMAAGATSRQGCDLRHILQWTT
jgi:hypothetical protein